MPVGHIASTGDVHHHRITGIGIGDVYAVDAIAIICVNIVVIILIRQNQIGKVQRRPGGRRCERVDKKELVCEISRHSFAQVDSRLLTLAGQWSEALLHNSAENWASLRSIAFEAGQVAPVKGASAED